jgi:hypothetical protein
MFPEKEGGGNGSVSEAGNTAAAAEQPGEADHSRCGPAKEKGWLIGTSQPSSWVHWTATRAGLSSPGVRTPAAVGSAYVQGGDDFDDTGHLGECEVGQGRAGGWVGGG